MSSPAAVNERQHKPDCTWATGELAGLRAEDCPCCVLERHPYDKCCARRMVYIRELGGADGVLNERVGPAWEHEISGSVELRANGVEVFTGLQSFNIEFRFCPWCGKKADT